jgi:hypothetical protein
MVAGLRNQSLFSFNHFRKPCNHPNLYDAVEIRERMGLKILPRSHVRCLVYGLCGPVLFFRTRRTRDLPVLVHVFSQRARVLRLRRTEQPLAK